MEITEKFLNNVEQGCFEVVGAIPKDVRSVLKQMGCEVEDGDEFTVIRIPERWFLSFEYREGNVIKLDVFDRKVDRDRRRLVYHVLENRLEILPSAEVVISYESRRHGSGKEYRLVVTDKTDEEILLHGYYSDYASLKRELEEWISYCRPRQWEVGAYWNGFPPKKYKKTNQYE